MRHASPALLLSLTALAALTALASGCKARTDGAKVRDDGDAAPGAASDLNAELSQLAAELRADASTYYAGASFPGNGDAIALDDERILTPAELDALRAQTAALNARLKKAQEAADRLAAQRADALARLRTRLDATTAALSRVDPADLARYNQGLADIRKVLDEMQAAAAIGTAAELPSCPAGYLPIPADQGFGTKAFCIMKYEGKFGADGKPASAPAGAPAKVSFTVAKQKCALLGPKYALATNPEWLATAANVAATAANWSGGAVGNGRLNTAEQNGRSLAAGTDDQPCANTTNSCTATAWANARRTYVLAGGGVIWDLAANEREWVDYQNSDRVTGNALEIATFPATTGMATSIVRPTKATHPFWNDAWSSDQGVGKYWGHTTSGTHLLRGGSIPSEAGLFTSMFWWDDNEEAGGIRCAFHP